jgi:tetratricopeptide (TPR) repeat protein
LFLRFEIIMRILFYIRFSIVTCLLALSARAQYTKSYDDPDAAFKTAKEFFQKNQYSLAFPVFKDLYAADFSKSNFPVSIQTEVKYYYITCGLKLNDASVQPLAIDFIDLEHHSPRIEMLSYELGEYYFRQSNFGEAINYYNKAGIENLTNNEIGLLKFHKGYAHFAQQQFAEAKPYFDAVRQMPKDENYTDANYYYGFICFSEKNYTEALGAFKIAETNPEYQPVVPFYIAEINYFTGDHDAALAIAEKAIKKGGQYYDLELKQLAGHLYFDKKEYAKAEPYLAEYVKKSDKVRREDLYELSYCYYAAANWYKSIDGFKQLSGKEDSLAQNSMYLLATAYLKTDQKANARNAFLLCESNNSNALQKEVSTFNYAKLSYELGFTDIALKETEGFLANYPNSVYTKEAKEVGVSVLAKTSNYKDALAMYESITDKSEHVKKIYPGILYGRAVELINDQKIEQADELLNKIIQAPYNNQLLQYVYFWKGEIAYRNGDAPGAVNYFANYLNDPKVNGEVNIINAKYSLAYSLLKKEEYTTALSYFLQVNKSISASSSPIEIDAYLRAADCYFMNKNYRQALTMYENVVAWNVKGADYALFQKAIIAGATNKNADKILLMQNLHQHFPNSSLNADANLEMANTYLADERFADASVPLQNILKDKNSTALWPQAYLKLGVVNFNLNKNEEALNNFTQLVAKYPNSQESDEAIEYIRNIFISNQRPSDFISFMKQNGKMVTYSEEDSLTFKAAQLKYEEKDFASAVKGYNDYLLKFSDGKYAIEANYFLAEINLANKNNEAALPYYNAVASKAPNRFAERSTLQSARIYYFDKKDYSAAEKYYTQLKSLATQQEDKLEAMRGLLRCQYKQQQWKEAAENAHDLLNEKSIATDDKLMASMVIAKSLQSENKSEEAIGSYKQVIALGKSEFSAEAQYRIAEILLQQNKFAEAEKAGFETIKKYGSYDVWVTRSYILLGDVYFKQKDYFNAEATYKSVAENASSSELKEEAQHKLNEVLNEKNKNSKVEQQ